MTIEDLEKYFINGYRFSMKTGWYASNFSHWKKQGFVPIRTQIKLEEMTNGDLKASLDHIKR